MLQDVKAPARGTRRPRTRIQSVSRAVQVLRYVAELEEGPATLSGIAAVVGTPLPTAYHLLATLVDEGMLVRDPKRGYRLGPTAGVLGDAFRREPPIPEGLLDPLRKLSAATGENCFLTAWQDGEVTLLRAVEGRFGIRIPKVTPGFTAFAHARAAGKRSSGTWRGSATADTRSTTRSSWTARHEPQPAAPRHQVGGPAGGGVLGTGRR
jgi:DNA-binding IclR family transcriptional regulator